MKVIATVHAHDDCAKHLQILGVERDGNEYLGIVSDCGDDTIFECLDSYEDIVLRIHKKWGNWETFTPVDDDSDF